MASDVDICNIALGHVGADAVVESIDPSDGSAEAGHCARLYPMARRELLEFHTWSFAKTRVELAPVANSSQSWGFAFELPSDCVSAVRVLTPDLIPEATSFQYFAPYPPNEQLGTFTERFGADYDVEGGVLRTNQPRAVLVYTRDITDATKFPPSFVAALAMLLASYLAGPIIKGNEGANANARLRQQCFGTDGHSGMAGRAAANDANSSAESAQYLPAAISVRA